MTAPVKPDKHPTKGTVDKRHKKQNLVGNTDCKHTDTEQKPSQRTTLQSTRKMFSHLVERVSMISTFLLSPPKAKFTGVNPIWIE